MGIRDRLSTAIFNNNNEEVSGLLKIMTVDNVNVTDSILTIGGLSPLHHACICNNIQALTKLLAFPGINVNKSAQTIFSSKVGKTPIMAAAHIGNAEALKLMLDDPRVDLDLKDGDGLGLEQFLDYCDDEKRKNICLGMIAQERNSRRNKTMEVQKNEDLEGIIGSYYTEQLERINSEIEDSSKRFILNTEQRRAKMRSLAQKEEEEKKILDFESNQAVVEMENQKAKLEQQLAKLQKNLDQAKQINKINQEEVSIKHSKERGVWRSKFAKEDKDDLDHLDNLKKMANQLTKNLRKRKRDLDTDGDASIQLEAARETLECPVCMDTMKPPSRIWMCPKSHLVCEPCKQRLDGRRCPTCRTEKVTLKAFMAEKFALTIFDK